MRWGLEYEVHIENETGDEAESSPRVGQERRPGNQVQAFLEDGTEIGDASQAHPGG